MSSSYATHLHLSILHIRNHGFLLIRDPCTLILPFISLHEVCVQISSRIMVSVRWCRSGLPTRYLLSILLISQKHLRVTIATLGVHMISALILSSDILLSISGKLQSLRTWCETSWGHCCRMVEFLNFLGDPGASHESILLIILCEIRVLSPFMRCALVYIRIEVLRLVTCGQARLVVWCRVARSCKATINFGVEAGRSFRSWWMKTCHLRLLTALFRRPAQIHSLSRHHTDDIVLTCVDSLAPCGCSTPQVVLIIELVVALWAIIEIPWAH